VADDAETRARDYTDRVIRDLRDQVQLAARLALEAHQDQVAGIASAIDHRLAELNNFRSALADQTRDFPTREVVDAMIGSVQAKADEREQRIRHLEQDKASTALVESLDQRTGQLELFVSNLKGRLWALGSGLLILQGIAGIIIVLLTRH
jgi:hypothetical protein